MDAHVTRRCCGQIGVCVGRCRVAGAQGEQVPVLVLL